MKGIKPGLAVYKINALPAVQATQLNLENFLTF